MKLPGMSDEIDTGDTGTKIILVGGVVVLAVVFLMSRSKKTPESSEQVVTIQPSQGQSWGDIVTPPDARGVAGYLGSYPVNIYNNVTGGKDDGDDTPAPGGWTPSNPGEINPAGKPYYCKPGWYMTTERDAPGNHVCQKVGGTTQTQVSYYEDPEYRYPAQGGMGSAGTFGAKPVVREAIFARPRPIGGVGPIVTEDRFVHGPGCECQSCRAARGATCETGTCPLQQSR